MGGGDGTDPLYSASIKALWPQIEEYTNELQEKERIIRKLEGKVDELEDKVAELEGEVEDLEGEVEDLKGEVEDTNNLECKVEELESQVAELEAKLDDKTESKRMYKRKVYRLLETDLHCLQAYNKKKKQRAEVDDEAASPTCNEQLIHDNQVLRQKNETLESFFAL